jgi:hypothetical protein
LAFFETEMKDSEVNTRQNNGKKLFNRRLTQIDADRDAGMLGIVVPESLKAGKPGSFKTQVFFTINDCYRGKII